MSDQYLPVPVDAAGAIADEFAKDQVIVLALDREHGLTHVTTYGKSEIDKQQAAAGGEALRAHLGLSVDRTVWYEDFRRAQDPSRCPTCGGAAPERRAALEALLLGMVRQACDADSRADLFPDAHRETEGDGAWDVYWSAHLGYYADAIRHLCRVGKLELLEDDGGRSIWARERSDAP